LFKEAKQIRVKSVTDEHFGTVLRIVTPTITSNILKLVINCKHYNFLRINFGSTDCTSLKLTVPVRLLEA
jgi:hypothetical protein